MGNTYWRGTEAGEARQIRGRVLVICGLWLLHVALLLRLPVLKTLRIHRG